jgi:hypothetical protein
VTAGPGTSLHAESYWLGALNPAEWSVDERVTTAATRSIGGLGIALSLSAMRFFRRHAERLRRIRTEGGQTSLLVAVSSAEIRSFSLAPEVCRMLDKLGITIEFEFASE